MSDSPHRLRLVRWFATWPRLVALLIVLLLGAFGAFRSLRSREVSTAAVERREVVASLVLNGRVLALARSSLGSPRGGRVARVLVEEGDPIRAGQVLVRLEDGEESAAEGEARARVVRQEAQLQSLRGTTAKVADEALAQARLEVDQAARQLARSEALHRDGLIPATDLESARRARDLAASRLRSAGVEQRSQAPGGGAARQAEADLAEARAALRAAEARREQTVIRAPADGLVLVRHVAPGDAVVPGRALLDVQLTSETMLLAQPDERNLHDLRLGQPALASADAFPDRIFRAELTYIAPNVDLERGTVDIKLRVPDPPADLRTDMTLSIDIETARKAGALVVPLDAVRDAAAGGTTTGTGTRTPWVLVLQRGRAVRRDLKLGLVGGENAEVLSGLAAGDVVIADLSVAPGARVHARKGH